MKADELIVITGATGQQGGAHGAMGSRGSRALIGDHHLLRIRAPRSIARRAG